VGTRGSVAERRKSGLVKWSWEPRARAWSREPELGTGAGARACSREPWAEGARLGAEWKTSWAGRGDYVRFRARLRSGIFAVVAVGAQRVVGEQCAEARVDVPLAAYASCAAAK